MCFAGAHRSDDTGVNVRDLGGVIGEPIYGSISGGIGAETDFHQMGVFVGSGCGCGIRFFGLIRGDRFLGKKTVQLIDGRMEAVSICGGHRGWTVGGGDGMLQCQTVGAHAVIGQGTGAGIGTDLTGGA